MEKSAFGPEAVNKKILLIDTRAGNLFSLRAAIERLGFMVEILPQPDEQEFAAVVIPGQGRFGRVMQNLARDGWLEYLQARRTTQLPILGICVGMQIFFEGSDEDPASKGLAWFSGRARALDFPKQPMVGWAKLESDRWPEAVVYFVNSFAIRNSDCSTATTTYGETFCAAVQKDNFFGVQFHPEKSAAQGAAILRDILKAQQGEVQ